MAQAQPLILLDLNTPSSEITAQTLVPATTPVPKKSKDTPSTSKNAEECIGTSFSTSTLTTKQQSQTQLHEPNPPPSLSLLPEDIPSIKWTAINDFSDPSTANSSSVPNSGKKQVSGTKTKRGQNMNNIYSTYSRGYRSIQPSPDPPHLSSSSLATQSTKNSAKSSPSSSSSSSSSASTVTAVSQPTRDLIQEQTTIRRRLRNLVSKTIANNALLQGTKSGDHEKRDKNNSYPGELPVCPFTQNQLDTKYRDAMLPFLQKHFSPSEAISSILKTSVQHFQWCCGMWDYVPVGNIALDDPTTTPQKEYTRLVKVLKQLENEHRSPSLPKAEEKSSDHCSLSRLQTPALSTCCSTASSTVSSPALTFSTPSTSILNFELDGAYKGHFGSEQCGSGFDSKADNEVHKGKEKTKDKKTKDPIEKPTKDHLKYMAKVNVESEAKAKIAGHAKTTAKEKSMSKATGKVKGEAKEQTKKGRAKYLPRDQRIPETNSRNVEKCGSDDISNAAEVSAQDKTSDASGKEGQRGVPKKHGPAVDASQKLTAQGIDKETLQDSTPRDQLTIPTKVSPVKDNVRETTTFEGHPRPSKHHLGDDDDSASLSAQSDQPSRRRKL